MRRSLITLAVVAGLAAILLAALALVDMVPRPNPADRQAPPVVTGHAAQSAAWAQPVKTTRVIEATDSATDLAAESAEPAATETAAGDQAAAEPAKGEPAVLSAVDCEAFVKDLSDEQSAELYVLLRTRRAYRDVKQRQRALMTDTKLQVLGMSRPELALTEVQKQRASAIKETLMPRMEPLLAEVWAKQDELVKKFQEALKGAKTQEEVSQVYQKNHDLMLQQYEVSAKMEELKKPLDAEYEAAVRAVLTPEQIKAIDEIYNPRGMPTPLGAGKGQR